ncbi:MAG: FAD-dependent oxidoreductase, partial [Nocardioides sp.]
MTERRRISAGTAGLAPSYDVVVIGLGVTGAGVALDAVSRGLSVLAVDARDVAFGTSRWSSKLVHGGLRYLAHGQVGVAHESAVERGILMETTAPHL